MHAIAHKAILFLTLFHVSLATTATTQPTVAKPATPAASASATDNKAEIDAANKCFHDITTCKNRIKEILTGIDNDITAAKTQVSEARKKNLELIRQENTQKASVMDAEVQQKLTVVTDLRKKVLEATTKSFTDEQAKIEKNIKEITAIVQKLKAKGVAFKTSQTKTLTDAINKEAAQKADAKLSTLPSSWAIPSNETATPAPAPTMVHYVMSRIADGISKIARVFYIFYNSCKEVFVGSQEKPASAGSTPSTIAPTTPPTQAPTTPSKFSFAQHEEGIVALEQKRSEMVLATHRLEAEIVQLSQTLASNAGIGMAIQTDLVAVTPVAPKPSWQATTECYVSYCLDGIAWAYERTKQTATKTYSNYIEPVVNKVRHDLQKEAAKDQLPAVKKIDAIPSIPAQNG